LKTGKSLILLISFKKRKTVKETLFLFNKDSIKNEKNILNKNNLK